jgi:hypothetical protein
VIIDAFSLLWKSTRILGRDFLHPPQDNYRPGPFARSQNLGKKYKARMCNAFGVEIRAVA